MPVRDADQRQWMTAALRKPPSNQFVSSGIRFSFIMIASKSIERCQGLYEGQIVVVAKP
jgi:hypothetical protein